MVRTDVLGISLNKPYAQQRVRLDASVEHNSYRDHDALDFNAVNASFAWEWTLTPSLTGILSADRKQVPTSFTDYRVFSSRNLRTNNNRLLILDYAFGGGWHVLASAGKQSSVSEDAAVPVEDEFRSTLRQVGLQYRFPSTSAIVLLVRRTDGDYPNLEGATPDLLNAPFHEQAGEVQATWKISEKTTITARMAHVDREHDEMPQRNFAGNTGRADLNWQITGKTSLTAGLGRDFTTWQTAYSNYIVTDSIYLAPVWQPTAKTALTLKLEDARRDFLGEPFGPVADVRRDRLRGTRLNFDWQATRDVLVGLGAQHSWRNSTYPGLDFSDNTLFITFKARFF